MAESTRQKLVELWGVFRDIEQTFQHPPEGYEALRSNTLELTQKHERWAARCGVQPWEKVKPKEP